MLICVGTGFASGLPLFLLIQLVPAWLRVEGISLTVIGFFALIQLPYNFKFVWAPLLERYRWPFLGLRRGWLLITQIGLIACIASLGFWDPQAQIWLIVWTATAIAVFSATQDVVIDAFRREILHTEAEQGMGNSVHVQVYRLAGFIPGSLGLILADYIAWDMNFAVMAAFMGVGVLLTLLVREPAHDELRADTLGEAVVTPFKEFFTRRQPRAAFAVLGFLLLYKLGDNMATALATPFYIDLGFELSEIGIIAKNAALWPAIAGGILGGLIIVKIGINRALWCFGVVQIITIFGFVWLSQTEPTRVALAVVIAAEYIGVGLGTAASGAFIARETSLMAVATQFALFTAIAALPRTGMSALSGVLIDSIGYTDFFYVCVMCALPGMVLLVWVAPWNERAPAPQETPRAEG